VSEIAERILDGCQRSAARVIRWLEDAEGQGVAAMKTLHRHSGRAHVVGITGPPGSGKSTLVDAVVFELRKRGRTVGVIAIDPSSPFSGGAILGDRVRMQRHATDSGVFIRSMATRGQLGGLARATFEASVVLDAMGQDVIVIETVGVGQDELDIAALAHTTVVVNVPGFGDEIQALKAGILEVGELFVLNKADTPGADETEKQLILMLHMRKEAEDGWEPPLLRTVAPTGVGVSELVDALERHHAHLEATDGLVRATADRSEHLFRELLRERASGRMLALAAASPVLKNLVSDVRSRALDPHTAVQRMLDTFVVAREEVDRPNREANEP
jgi:LAO/AO transport system kinase